MNQTVTDNINYAYVVQASSAEGIVSPNGHLFLGIFSSREPAEQCAREYVEYTCDQHGVEIVTARGKVSVRFFPAGMAAPVWWVSTSVTRHVLR